MTDDKPPSRAPQRLPVRLDYPQDARTIPTIYANAFNLAIGPHDVVIDLGQTQPQSMLVTRKPGEASPTVIGAAVLQRILIPVEVAEEIISQIRETLDRRAHAIAAEKAKS